MNTNDWKEHWKDMPEYLQEKKKSYVKIIIRFDNEEDLINFANLIGQNINKNTKSIWFPYKKRIGKLKKQWKDES